MSDTAQSTKQPSVAQLGQDRDQEYAFRFVEVGEPSQDRDEDNRTVIRSHVMRDYYVKRDRRRKPNTVSALSPVVPKKAGLPQTQRFRVGPQGLQEVKKRRRRIDPVPRGLSVAGSVATVEAPVLPDTPTRRPTSVPPSAKSIRKCASDARDQNPAAETSLSHHVISLAGSHLPGSTLDPFHTLPPSKSPQTQQLLYYADRGILSSRLMGQLRKEWLSLATQDTALFHIALSHYAGNYGLARRQNDPVEALRFRMEAMRIVNERLENMDSALTDGTLGTVASLSSYEATNGTIIAIETHMKGLQRLVTLRGDLRDLNQHTRRLILWADLNCANALGVLPAFPLFQSDKPAPAVSRTDPVAAIEDQWPSALLFGEAALPSISLQSMTRELKDNFTILKQFSELSPVTQANKEEDKKRQVLESDKLYFTERSLLNLTHCWGPSKFATSGCLAAIIFIDNYLRGIVFHARIMDRLVARLQFSMNMVLSDIPRHNTNKESTKAMFWVLFVGGLAAGTRPERDWFISYLLILKDGLCLQSWEETKSILEAFLWPKVWYGLGKTLWVQMQQENTTSQALSLALNTETAEQAGRDQWGHSCVENEFADSDQ